MSKFSMAIAFGAGYVVGARAGQERYRQIQSKAKSVWQSDTVQTQASKAQDVAKDQAAKAKEGAKDRLSHLRDDSDGQSSAAGPITTVADAPPSEDMVDQSRRTGVEDPDGPEALKNVSPGSLS